MKSILDKTLDFNRDIVELINKNDIAKIYETLAGLSYDMLTHKETYSYFNNCYKYHEEKPSVYKLEAVCITHNDDMRFDIMNCATSYMNNSADKMFSYSLQRSHDEVFIFLGNKKNFSSNIYFNTSTEQYILLTHNKLNDSLVLKTSENIDLEMKLPQSEINNYYVSQNVKPLVKKASVKSIGIANYAIQINRYSNVYAFLVKPLSKSIIDCIGVNALTNKDHVELDMKTFFKELLYKNNEVFVRSDKTTVDVPEMPVVSGKNLNAANRAFQECNELKILKTDKPLNVHGVLEPNRIVSELNKILPFVLFSKQHIHEIKEIENMNFTFHDIDFRASNMNNTRYFLEINLETFKEGLQIEKVLKMNQTLMQSLKEQNIYTGNKEFNHLIKVKI